MTENGPIQAGKEPGRPSEHGWIEKAQEKVKAADADRKKAQELLKVAQEKAEIEQALEAKKKADAFGQAIQKEVTAAQKALTEFLDGKSSKERLKSFAEEKLRLLASEPQMLERMAGLLTKASPAQQAAIEKELQRFDALGLSRPTGSKRPASAFEKAIKKNTRMVWVETPSNPLLKIIDLEAIGKIAREHNIISVSDNTFATPWI